jgi:hypothetical protein
LAKSPKIAMSDAEVVVALATPTEGKNNGAGAPNCAGLTAARRDQAAADQDNQLIRAERSRSDRDESGRGEQSGFDRGARQPHERLHHDRDHHGLERVQRTCGDRKLAESHVQVGDRHHDQYSGQNEARAGNQEADRPATHMPDVDRQFCRVRAGNQVRRAEVVEELLAREPFSAHHDFLFHHRDVRGRSTEGDRSELQEHAGDVSTGNVGAGGRRHSVNLDRHRPIERSVHLIGR